MLLTATGDIDFKHPALVKGAIVITTESGAKKIGNDCLRPASWWSWGKGKSLDLNKAIGEVRGRGLDVLLV